ncbi:MAG: hypothetical protein PHH26_00850 [Candidatus Thermoplasmatota archaeon]|nr:hypothetical protein [Candidatus Thermoplasmatota archaeon]
MAMNVISVVAARKIAEEKKLRPAMVKGTNVIQFTRKGGANLEMIPWGNFEKIIKERKVKVYESGGWMKIMK